MKSKRQKWAIKRNWLILRLKGAHSIFSHSLCQFMYKLIPMDKYYIVDSIDMKLEELIEAESKSKYKE